MRHKSKVRVQPARQTIGGILAAFGVLYAVAGGPAGALAAAKHAAMVVDANSGRVLYARAADEPRFPASLTKMMTLYIVFELMQQGRLEPATRIRISGSAAAAAPSKLGLEEGADIALIDAIKVLITKSANDVAVAVAEHIAGSEEKFALLMTRKARSLGMNATVFKNAHGLTHPQQITTARDMITLALRLNDDFPRYYGLFATRTFSYDSETYRNHNTLLGRFEGIDGIKTGYTAASGFNLVSSVRRDGRHVVGAVFGGATAAGRNAYMRTLLARALTQASTRKTREPAIVAKAPTPPERVKRPPAVAEAARSPTGEDPQAANPVNAQQLVRAPSADADETAAPRMTQGPRIEIARVRPVLVAPRARSGEPAQSPQVELAAAQVRPGSASFVEAQPVAGDAALAVRGAAPSSLEAQAGRLSRGQAAIGLPAWTASLDNSANVPAALAGGDSVNVFAVQVGAFGSEDEARRQLQSALDRSEGLLDGRLPTTQPVRHAGRQLYRARFSGFDSHTAASACQELRRRQIDCHVARAE